MFPAMRRVVSGVLVLSLLVLAACAAPIQSPPGTTTTVVLIRHAERFGDALTEAGRARAAALPAAVADLDIAAIYSPELVRNRQTVASLAAERGLDVTVIEPSRVGERLVREHPGRTVLWVGNTTNLGSIFRELGGEGPPPNTYGDLYILRVHDAGPPEVIKRRYGD